MEILLTNIFPKKGQPTLGLTPTGGGEGDSAEGTQNFQKGRQAPPPPPWGRVCKPIKKGLIGGRAVLNGEKKEFRYQFSQNSPQALHVLNHGWWRLAVGNWRLAVVGGWQFATGNWWRLVVGSWWRLVVGGWWRLALGHQ